MRDSGTSHIRVIWLTTFTFSAHKLEWWAGIWEMGRPNILSGKIVITMEMYPERPKWWSQRKPHCTDLRGKMASAMVVMYGPVVALIWTKQPRRRESGQKNEIQSISKYCSGRYFVPVSRNLGWLEKRTYCSTIVWLVVLIRPSFAASNTGSVLSSWINERRVASTRSSTSSQSTCDTTRFSDGCCASCISYNFRKEKKYLLRQCLRWREWWRWLER